MTMRSIVLIAVRNWIGVEMSDLVKREDVFEALYEAIKTDFKGTFINSVSLAIEIGNNIPSVEPEQKKGEWVVHDYALGRERYECTECKGRCDLEYNFCPHCGADMRGEHE